MSVTADPCFQKPGLFDVSKEKAFILTWIINFSQHINKWPCGPAAGSDSQLETSAQPRQLERKKSWVGRDVMPLLMADIEVLLKMSLYVIFLNFEEKRWNYKALPLRLKVNWAPLNEFQRLHRKLSLSFGTQQALRFPECLAVICQWIGPTRANIYQCYVVSEAQQQRHRVLRERQTTFSRQHNGGVTTWFPSKKMQNLNPPFNTHKIALSFTQLLSSCPSPFFSSSHLSR